MPGIRYVVDPAPPGSPATATGSRCSGCRSSRSRRRRPNQRAGRCGRVADGHLHPAVLRGGLRARPAFTEPEILRTNLASVILQMAALGLGDVGRLPVPRPAGPARDQRRGRAARGARRADPGTSGPAGAAHPARAASWPQLPIDPRLGRMVLEAERNGCLREVLVIAAALSIQDPRERPADKQQAADAAARPVRRPGLRLPRLPEALGATCASSSSAVRQPVPAAVPGRVPQLPARARVAGPRTASCARRPRRPRASRTEPRDRPTPTRVHTALLAGLLSHIGMRRRRPDGARVRRRPRRPVRDLRPARRWPRSRPRWVMAAELVETNRLWARTVAADRAGVGRAARRPPGQAHLQRAALGREARRRGGAPSGHAVRAADRRRPHGGLRPDRPGAGPGAVHPARAGRGRLGHPPRVLPPTTAQLLDEVEELEHRARRRDILVDDEALFDFYDRGSRPTSSPRGHFDAWWKRARADTPDLLHVHPRRCCSSHDARR